MDEQILQRLATYGQSIWLDNINRFLIQEGQLKRWIAAGLRGVTTNPSTFQQVMSQGCDYDAEIIRLKHEGKSALEIYDDLSVRDIQEAADIFLPVYYNTQKLDGYVSLEMNPQLAHNAPASIEEGRRLFSKVNRPNCMIKIPATPAGFQVVETLIANEINVNITLIFSMAQYQEAAQAYLRGLDRLGRDGSDLGHVCSVASVFVSRIDSAVDQQIERKLVVMSDSSQAFLRDYLGKAAVAQCALIFEKSKEIFTSPVFLALAHRRAKMQRLLWGETATKNPAYRDVKYIEELICRPTVSTVPEATLRAFLDHGKRGDGFSDLADRPDSVLQTLSQYGIDLDAICHKLLTESLDENNKTFSHLLRDISQKAELSCQTW